MKVSLSKSAVKFNKSFNAKSVNVKELGWQSSVAEEQDHS
jgi:hypothetical protein